MTERQLFDLLVVLWIALAPVVFVVLLLVSAPYGRHARPGVGPTVGARAGWVVMEAPAVVVFGACFLFGERGTGAAPAVFLVLWQLHYVHRAFVFPFRLRGGSRMPAAIVAGGFAFNVVNGYLNGRYLYALSPSFPAGWAVDPRFVAGVLVFAAGFAVNLHSDNLLMGLRRTGAGGYVVPRGGLFRWVSCPNYLGEIVEWAGWAIAAWSLPGLAFAAWTAANLVPRARAHHAWYRTTFPDYPPGRRALLPFIY